MMREIGFVEVIMTAVSPLKLRIEGMDCGACATKIENAMKRLPGVADVNVSYGMALLSLMLDEDRTSRDAIAAQIRVLGFTPVHIDDKAGRIAPQAQVRGPWWQSARGRLVIGI